MSEEVSDAQIADWVKGLYDRNYGRSDDCYKRLTAVPRRAVPFLAEQLQHRRVRTMTYQPVPEEQSFQLPLLRMISLLAASGSEEAVAAFLEYLQGAEPRFRLDMARSLGCLAAENCIEPVKSILAGEQKGLRGMAMAGIGQALAAGRGVPAFFQAIRPHLVELLNNIDDACGQAPKLLLEIDAGWATPILLSPAHFSLSNPQLHYILAALNQANIPIPHSLLLSLIDELEAPVDKHLRGREIAEALLAYALNSDAQTETRLRGMLRSPAAELQTGAARALAALKGLHDVRGKVRRLAIVKGIGVLSEAERNYVMVTYYLDAPKGGLWQYLGTSMADNHKSIVAGLVAIGAAESARILDEAGQVFGPDGPPEDFRQRSAARRAFTRQREEVFSRLNQAYLIRGENVEMLAFLYVAEHADEFVYSVGADELE